MIIIVGVSLSEACGAHSKRPVCASEIYSKTYCMTDTYIPTNRQKRRILHICGARSGSPQLTDWLIVMELPFVAVANKRNSTNIPNTPTWDDPNTSLNKYWTGTTCQPKPLNHVTSVKFIRPWRMPTIHISFSMHQLHKLDDVCLMYNISPYQARFTV